MFCSRALLYARATPAKILRPSPARGEAQRSTRENRWCGNDDLSSSCCSCTQAPMSVPEQAKMSSRVETLTPARFGAARAISNEFLGTTGKRPCCVLSFACCPESESEFAAQYRLTEQQQLTAIVVQEQTDRVIGVVKLGTRGVPRGVFDHLMHTLKDGEVYIEWMSVTSEARGQGAGKKMLEWAEATARARGATSLTLGVVNGNPARRLYERFGFVEEESGVCSKALDTMVMSCIFGMPHGQLGGVMMEKKLT